MSTRLPNFLIIGAPRSGSTYLARNLAAHPDIFFAGTGHEYSTGDVHFFDVNKPEGRENAQKGLDWYAGLFSGAGERPLAGEKTADYLADPDAPGRIRDTLGPQVRLIACLREPVARAYSHYWHERPNLPLFFDFESAFFDAELNRRIWLQDSGLYRRNLNRYFEVFERSRMLVLIHEEVMRDPLGQFRAICQFLSIDERFLFPYLGKRINQTVNSGPPYWTMRAAGLLKRGFPSLFARLVDSPLASGARKLMRRSRGIPAASPEGAPEPAAVALEHVALPPDQVERIREFYMSDVRELGTLLDRNMLDFWWGGGARGTDG
ncbi:MAG TPA: sulfotransferase [Gammaproteobacteria bacterium]|nr:sulfotransferase [Gammaproteobacteria bacterium]